jgi:hypothetical protein
MKTILIVTSIFIFTLSFTTGNGKPPAENGNLAGAVTYKESYKSPNQAGAGCEIYIINEVDIQSTQYADISTVIVDFMRNKTAYTISRYNTVDPASIVKSQDIINTFSNYAGKYISGFKKLPAITRRTTNSAGNYSVSLRPGKYYVLFVSGNVRSNNSVEINGNIDYKIVEIRSAGETFRDVTFVKNELIGLRLTTGRQLTGC